MKFPFLILYPLSNHRPYAYRFHSMPPNFNSFNAASAGLVRKTVLPNSVNGICCLLNLSDVTTTQNPHERKCEKSLTSASAYPPDCIFTYTVSPTAQGSVRSFFCSSKFSYSASFVIAVSISQSIDMVEPVQLLCSCTFRLFYTSISPYFPFPPQSPNVNPSE